MIAKILFLWPFLAMLATGAAAYVEYTQGNILWTVIWGILCLLFLVFNLRFIGYFFE